MTEREELISIATLRKHWLHAIECDHERKLDHPICACSRVDLGWHSSVGAAVDAWIAHVLRTPALPSETTELWRQRHEAASYLERQPEREAVLTFDEFRRANVARCIKWHPAGIESWSASDWMTAIMGELGEAASLIKMRNRERDGLPGNKFSPTQKQIADELADVLTYLDLLAAMQGIDLGRAAVEKFNEVSERVGFPDRIRALEAAPAAQRSIPTDANWMVTPPAAQEPAPQQADAPVAQKCSLTPEQLAGLCTFSFGMSCDAPEDAAPVTIGYLPEHECGAGWYVWCTEYPEEGSMPIHGKPQAEQAGAAGEGK